MTDLLESFLVVYPDRTRAPPGSMVSIALMLQRAVAMARSHPASRDVKITLKGLSLLDASIDSKKLGRAVFNLVLNACRPQSAAKRRQPSL